MTNEIWFYCHHENTEEGNLEIGLKFMDELYHKLCLASTNSSRKYYEHDMLAVMKANPSIKEYWNYDSQKHYIINRFEKISHFYNTEEKPRAERIEGSGIYLIGNTTFNPFTKEEFYWLKVGKSTDLKKRMKNYDTCSPTIWHIDFKNCTALDAFETRAHSLLDRVAIGFSETSVEWVRVSKEQYLEICDRGFDWFEFSDIEYILSIHPGAFN